MSEQSDNLVRNPTFAGNMGPEGWTFVTPRPELALEHGRLQSGNGMRLALSGTGDQHAFGCWEGEADLKDGQWYRASVRVRFHGIPHPELSLFAQAGQHFL